LMVAMHAERLRRRRIIAEVKGTRLVAADHQGKIEERRTTFFKKLATFRRLQIVFMPGAQALLDAEEALRDQDTTPIAAEAVKLWMPHQVLLQTGCVPGLRATEAKLRVAQCQNALVTLRTRLHAKRHFISYRNANITGQIQSTKAATLIGQIGERVDAAAAKYRQGWAALVELSGGPEHVPQFRALLDADVRLDGDWGESDGAARKKLTMIGAGRGARAPRNQPGTSKAVMSWIWTAPGALDDAEKHLHACESVADGLDVTDASFFSGARRVGPCASPEESLGGRGDVAARGDETCAKVFNVAGRVVGRAWRRQDGC
jgi:hypothetical protein